MKIVWGREALWGAPKVAPDSVREFKAQRPAAMPRFPQVTIGSAHSSARLTACGYLSKLGATRDAFKLPSGVGSHIGHATKRTKLH